MQKPNTHLTTILAFSAGFLVVLIPSVSLAVEYTPLVGVPGLQNTGKGDLPQYLNNLYLLTILLGALLAAFKIAFAGIKWSMSEVVSDKTSAKSDIKGALLGLAILLLPYLVLQQINPSLTNLDVLRGAPSVDLTPKQAPGGASPQGPDYGPPAPDYSDSSSEEIVTQADLEEAQFRWIAKCNEQGKQLKKELYGGPYVYRLSCVANE